MEITLRVDENLTEGEKGHCFIAVKPLIGFFLPSSQRQKEKINISVISAPRAKDVEHPAAGGKKFFYPV
ncbi:MAG: hypothetical protein EHM45_11800 [Desulfobacteraceae bacterium]|nr:MAG: hypothetical protein EHM45_11800 [Desulfobacteraceae bacterium]